MTAAPHIVIDRVSHVYRPLRDRQRSRKTVVFVMHDVREAVFLAERSGAG